MREIHIAFKFEERSAATQHILQQIKNGSDVSVITGRALPKILEPKVTNLWRKTFLALAIVAYFINRAKNLFLGVRKDVIFSSVKRNVLMEHAVNIILRRQEFDRVFIHWCGYGFLPPKSIFLLESSLKTIVHHDWRFFTGGCHVPAKCFGFPSQCLSCPYVERPVGKRYVENSRKLTADYLSGNHFRHLFVSHYQKKLIQKKLPSIVGEVRQNTLRRAFLRQDSAKSLYAIRRAKSDAKWILFLGVNDENDGNKGAWVLNWIFENTNIFKGSTLFAASCKGLTFSPDVSFSNLESDEVFALMSAADVVLVPSRIETFSLVAYEALRCHTPVVVFPETAPCTFGEERMLFVAKNNLPDDFADAIVTALKAKEREMSENWDSSTVDSR